MPTIRIRKIAAITEGMSLKSLPSLRYAPRPKPSSGPAAMISAAISERHEKAQPCLQPAR